MQHSSSCASFCSSVPATPCVGTTAGPSNSSVPITRKEVRSMTNGSGPDHHDDRKTVERKEPKRAAGKRSAKEVKKPAAAK